VLKTERLSVKATPQQKAAVEALARMDGETVALTIRRLIVSEARQRGLWPPHGQAQRQAEATGGCHD